MHDSALLNAKRFFETYAPHQPASPLVVDLGSMNVNGSIKQVCQADFRYIGIDFEPGPGVDHVMKEPYSIPVQSDSIDMVVASSVFEHSPMFWLLFLEVMRILKPTGLFYLNVPSNGAFHRHPLDCWRFYPDAADALAQWAKINKLNTTFLESWWSAKGNDGSEWNDFVAVFLKDEKHVDLYPNRIPFDIAKNGQKLWKIKHGEIYNARFHGWAEHQILDLQDFPQGGQTPIEIKQNKPRINIE